MHEVKRNRTILVDRLEEHSAFLAWRSIDPTSAPPASIELLKGGKTKTVVYRLRMRGKCPSVILKRQQIGGLSKEARLYADVLPALSLPVVECYGFLEEFRGDSWIILEDAGDYRFSRQDVTHWPLAIRWMACLHSTPTDRIAGLSQTGAAYFLMVLRKARQGVRRCLAHPAIKSASVGALNVLLKHLDVIEGDWLYVDQVCSNVPQTLVHGDFVPKNARLRTRDNSRELLVIDWEMAGATPPAVDIAMIPGGRAEREAYFTLLKNVWPNLSWKDVERLHRIGLVFRLLHAIEWKSRSFEHSWIEKPERHMLTYQRALQDPILDGLWLQE